MSTMLERWHDDPLSVGDDEIRRAIAIAQAYNEWGRLEEPLIRRDEKNLLIAIGQRADELLEGK